MTSAVTQSLSGPHRDTVAVVTAAVVLLGGMVAFAPRTGDDPGSVVAEYLAALRANDIDRALQMTEEHRPAGQAAGFLTPKAGTGDWSVDRIELADREEHYEGSPHDDPSSETAVVSFDIAIPGRKDTAGSIALQREAGEDWVIAPQMTLVELPDTPLRYDDVNGARTSQAGEPYALLPGVYTAHSTPNDLVNVKSKTLAVFPQQAEYSSGMNLDAPIAEFDDPAASLSKKGLRKVQKAVKARINECAAETSPEPPGCPFDVDPFGFETEDGDYVGPLSEVSWEIVEQPEIAASADDGVIKIADRTPGKVRLHSESDGGGTVQCDIRSWRLQAEFTRDGAVKLLDGTGSDPHTCES